MTKMRFLTLIPAPIKARMRPVLRRMTRSAAIEEFDRFACPVPIRRAINDVYLVSFPKSGSVWLSFMLANVNLLMSGQDDRRATFFNLHDLIPDVHASRDIPERESGFPGFRIIKSHAEYNSLYLNVILVVRDPVHVMASYYKYMTEQNGFGGTITEFVGHPDFGIDAWASHTMGWLNGAHPDFSFCSLCLVKYEELCGDPHGTLREIYRLMGFDLKDEVIAEAVERSSVVSMQAEEERLNARHPSRRGFEFVRKAGAVGPRVAIDASLRQKIVNQAQPVLTRLGYC